MFRTYVITVRTVTAVVELLVQMRPMLRQRWHCFAALAKQRLYIETDATSIQNKA
jgi:hypothetical protein